MLCVKFSDSCTKNAVRAAVLSRRKRLYKFQSEAKHEQRKSSGSCETKIRRGCKTSGSGRRRNLRRWRIELLRSNHKGSLRWFADFRASEGSRRRVARLRQSDGAREITAWRNRSRSRVRRRHRRVAFSEARRPNWKSVRARYDRRNAFARTRKSEKSRRRKCGISERRNRKYSA